jgi:transposase-like protein
MSDLHIRCMRCGTEMEMRDPGPGRPWTPDQFWVCNKCGRHFWTTYPPPKTDAPPAPAPVVPAAAAAPKAAAEPVS